MLTLCAATSPPESPTLIDFVLLRVAPFLVEYARAASKRESVQAASEVTDEDLLIAKSAGSAVRAKHKELEAAVAQIERELVEMGLTEDDAKSVILSTAVSETDRIIFVDILYP